VGNLVVFNILLCWFRRVSVEVSCSAWA